MSDYLMELRELVGSRPLITCGACVIIMDDRQRILLQHRTDTDAWGLPGGTMNIGETMEDTARREVSEEVGLTCHGLKLINVFSGPDLHYRYPHGDEVYHVAVAYLCRDVSGDLKVDGVETKDAVFFAVEDLPSDINPPDRVILDYFRTAGQEAW